MGCHCVYDPWPYVESSARAPLLIPHTDSKLYSSPCSLNIIIGLEADENTKLGGAQKGMGGQLFSDRKASGLALGPVTNRKQKILLQTLEIV